MHHTESNPSQVAGANVTEEGLRRENDELRRQLEELKKHEHSLVPGHLWRPSATTIWALFLTAAVLLTVAFLGGFIPLQNRRALAAAEARTERQAIPRVEFIKVGRSTRQSGLMLPGNIEPVTEAPVLARADGYLERRMVDIGDKVSAGQALAEIDAPELDDQVAQAKATVRQAEAALEQAIANVAEGKTTMELARVTAQRSGQLIIKGAVSRQDDDQYQAEYQSKLAALQALEKAIDVQRANLAAAQSNVARLDKMQNYRVVVAPFDGVITVRNVDVGALVNAGNTLLFRIAQMAVLRTYINVPQTYADSIRPGQPAVLTVTNLPGRQFKGDVARTASALDPASRTLLVEIHVPNEDKALLPGMYAQVELSSVRADPPLLIPSDALIVRDNGSQVAVIRSDSTVHLQKIEVARDYGDRIEVVGGLHDGDAIVSNPDDEVQDGMKVDPVAVAPSGK